MVRGRFLRAEVVPGSLPCCRVQGSTRAETGLGGDCRVPGLGKGLQGHGELGTGSGEFHGALLMGYLRAKEASELLMPGSMVTITLLLPPT